MSHLVKNYNRKKISFKFGRGSFLYSTNGKKYLDFVQGIAVNSLGHANPYLVMAAVAAGIHHGIISQSDPGEMIAEGVEMEHDLTLPRTWDKALEVFESGNNLSRYIGAEYHRIFSAVRRSECDMFAAKVSNVDYEWYLRSI